MIDTRDMALRIARKLREHIHALDDHAENRKWLDSVTLEDAAVIVPLLDQGWAAPPTRSQSCRT
jgi:hypothetical protein